MNYLKSALLCCVFAFLGGVVVWFVKPATSPSVKNTVTVQTEAATSNTSSNESNAIKQEIELVPGLTFSFEGRLAWYRALAPLSAEQLLDVLDQSRQIFKKLDYATASGIAFAKFAELYPEAAIRKALQFESGEATRMLGTIYRIWAHKDFAKARESAAQLPFAHRENVYVAMLSALEEFGSRELQRELAHELGVKAVAANDPFDAWTEALEESEQNSKQFRSLSALAVKMVATDPEKTMALIDALDSPDAFGLQSMAMGQWGKIDPRAALSWINGNTKGRDRSTLTGTVVKSYAAQDLDAARQAAEALREQPEAVAAVAAVANAWVAKDPESTMEWLVEMGNQGVDLSDGVLLGRQLGIQTPDFVDRWLPRLPGLMGDRAFSTSIRNQANTDPRAAAERLETLTNEKRRADGIDALMRSWSTSEPAAAAQWMAEATLGEQERSRRLQTAMKEWGARDEDAAMAYATKLNDTHMTESVLIGVAESTQDLDALEDLYARIEQPLYKMSFRAIASQKLRDAAPEDAERLRKLAGLGPNGDIKVDLDKINSCLAESAES